MANTKASLVIYVKKEKGWTRYPAWRSTKNGKLKAGHAKIDDQPIQFATYTYQARTFKGRTAIHTTLGPDPVLANERFKKLAKEHAFSKKAADLGYTKPEDPSRTKFATAAKEYVQRTKDSGHLPAADVYRVCYEMFQEACPEVEYLDQITEKAMLKFHRYLREERGNADVSINNRDRQMLQMLLWCGVGTDGKDLRKRKIIAPEPDYDDKLVDVFDRDELSTLFATLEDPATPLFQRKKHERSCTNLYFYTVLSILRMTGLRESEASFLMWTDFDWKRKEIKVQAKPHLGFRLKDREARRVQIPPKLVPVLEAWRKVVPPTQKLVVGRHNDTPHRNWLVCLKRLAYLAGLSCGHCEGCMKSDGKQCEHWTLHGFRRTYATALDEAGFSLRQIMDLLGHADIQTTMRYLGNRSMNDMQSVQW